MSKSQTVPVGFVATVLALVKGGDEGKVTRFQQRAIKFCNKQIKANTDRMADLDDQIDDKKDNFNDALTGVDMDAIKSTSNLHSYIPDYLSNLSSFKKGIKTLEDAKDDAQDQIDKYKSLIEDLK